jgi:MinD superfamily P-loop ATPase
VLAELPVIIQERCNGCGLCIGVCTNDALVLVDNVITIIEVEECDWCAICEMVCPTGAILCPFEIVLEEHI